MTKFRRISARSFGVVLALAGVAALAGCDLFEPDYSPMVIEPSPSSEPGAPPVHVESVIGDLGHVTMTCGTGSAYEECQEHKRNLEALEKSRTQTTPPPPVHVESVVDDLRHVTMTCGNGSAAQDCQEHKRNLEALEKTTPPPQTAQMPGPAASLPEDYDFPKEWYDLADQAGIPPDVDFSDYDCPEDFLDDLDGYIKTMLAQGVPATDPKIVASRKLYDEIDNEPPCCFFAEFYGGGTFSETGIFSNSDFSENPNSSFGNGYTFGFYGGRRMVSGLYLGLDASYSGGLSPKFTATGQQATGSAHAETLLLDARVYPGQISPALRPYTTFDTKFVPLGFKLMGQLYLEGGIGPSFNTMSSLNGVNGGVPSGTGPGSTQTQLAYQLGVGVQLDLSHQGFKGVDIDFKYLYRDLGDFSSTNTFNQAGGGTINRPALKTDVSSHNLIVGVGYHF